MKRYLLDLLDCFFMAKNTFFYWYEDHKKLRRLERGEITLDQYNPF